MDIPALHAAPIVSMTTRAPTPERPGEVAQQMEAMMFELFLRQAGLLEAISGKRDGEGNLYGEMMIPLLANQLAREVQLGFGKLMITQPSTS